jgi:hypothetical protein
MYDKYHAGKHGDVALKFLEEFNVNIPTDEWEAFRSLYPDVKNQLKPAFHGTGSIAASMILRFGFKIADIRDMQSAGVGVAGRMLGDGIYIGRTLDKVAGYVGDGSWQRKYGTIGYIFEIDATLGKQGQDFNAAGLGNDNIRSPEWCVFNPRKQLKLIKVYKVELTSKSKLNKMRLNESNKKQINKFDSILLENINSSLIERKLVKNDSIKWVFYDGDVVLPTNKNTIKSIDMIKITNKDISISPHQYGTCIEMRNSYGLNDTISIKNVFEFMKQDPDGLFTQYKTLMAGKIK